MRSCLGMSWSGVASRVCTPHRWQTSVASLPRRFRSSRSQSNAGRRHLRCSTDSTQSRGAAKAVGQKMKRVYGCFINYDTLPDSSRCTVKCYPRAGQYRAFVSFVWFKLRSSLASNARSKRGAGAQPRPKIAPPGKGAVRLTVPDSPPRCAFWPPAHTVYGLVPVTHEQRCLLSNTPQELFAPLQ
jgi:hypothetical protein